MNTKLFDLNEIFKDNSSIILKNKPPVKKKPIVKNKSPKKNILRKDIKQNNQSLQKYKGKTTYLLRVLLTRMV